MLYELEVLQCGNPKDHKIIVRLSCNHGAERIDSDALVNRWAVYTQQLAMAKHVRDKVGANTPVHVMNHVGMGFGDKWCGLQLKAKDLVRALEAKMTLMDLGIS